MMPHGSLVHRPTRLLIPTAMTLTFIVDLNLPLGYAVWAPYFASVAMAAQSPRIATVIRVTLASCALVAIEPVLNPTGYILVGLTNRAVGIFTLLICAILSVRHQRLRYDGRATGTDVTPRRGDSRIAPPPGSGAQSETEPTRVSGPGDLSHAEFLESTPAILWRTAGWPPRIAFISAEAERLLGYSRHEWSADPDAWLARVHADDRAHVHSRFEDALHRDEDHHFVFRMIATDNRLVSLHAAVRVVVDHDHTRVLLGVMSCIPRGLEFHSTASNTGGLALRPAEHWVHQFNNVLSVVRGHVELLREEAPSLGTTRRVDELQRALDRAAALTQQLLSSSGARLHDPKATNLNHVVNGLVRHMLHGLADHQIGVATSLENNLDLVTADPVQLEHILLDLATMAGGALRRGGRLTIRTSNVVLSTEQAVHHGARPGPHVLLTVSGADPGMDAATISRLFERFVNAKTDTGSLVLTTMYDLLRQNKGHMNIRSTLDEAATFDIYLPRHEGWYDPADSPMAGRATSGATRTILLVESEPLLRKLLRIVLEEAGYIVLETPDAVSAATTSATHAGPIHLLLTDIVPRDGTGPTLAAALRRTRPDLQVLYMSGYAEQATANDATGLAERDAVILPKPISPDALLNKVRAILK
jgi:signal transduction histidine kinase/CheY-like chemotaxis protein